MLRLGWLAVVYLCCQVLIWLWVDPLHAPDWKAWVGGCFIAAVGVVAAFGGLDCWMDGKNSGEQSNRTSVDACSPNRKLHQEAGTDASIGRRALCKDVPACAARSIASSKSIVSGTGRSSPSAKTSAAGQGLPRWLTTTQRRPGPQIPSERPSLQSVSEAAASNLEQTPGSVAATFSRWRMKSPSLLPSLPLSAPPMAPQLSPVCHPRSKYACASCA